MKDELMDAASKGPGRPKKVDVSLDSEKIGMTKVNPIVAEQATENDVIVEMRKENADLKAMLLDVKKKQDHPDTKASDSAISALQEENASLMKMLLEMKEKLMPEDPKPEKGPAKLDKTRPFSKIRSLDTGIHYTQDGLKYNGKFELLGKAE